MSLDDACSLVAARGALMQELPVGGAMVAVQATEDEVVRTLAGREDRGEHRRGQRAVLCRPVRRRGNAVLEIAGYWSERGRQTRRLRVSHAFHSPRMDQMLTEFRWVAETRVVFAPPAIPVVSALTGALATAGELCSPGYWVRHVRETVRFGDAIQVAARPWRPDVP